MNRSTIVRFAFVAVFAVLVMGIGCRRKPVVAPDAGGGSQPSKVDEAGGGLTDEEMARASKTYFDRCAGCHGTTRKGATGPSLEPRNTRLKGMPYLVQTITQGTIRGMPDWGKQGILKPEEINLLARFIQEEPPAPPEMTMAQMKSFHRVFVQPENRPKAPEHKRDWLNFMGVILRDVGKVAIIDGDTKEKVNVINTGFAVHILRSSASGRYFYAVGRDGKVTMIDLWMAVPDKVAEIKVSYDARSLDTSKFKGFEDKYVVVGGYWPPSLIFLRGDDLSPIKVVSTASYTWDTNEYLREARVASIVSSHSAPVWVTNIKETGQVWLVDYSLLDQGSVDIKMINAERFLHDGGWDSTKRYFLVAANMRNKVAVIDTLKGKLVKLVDCGIKPHPGRGVNIIHPRLGPLWGTGHLADNTIRFIGTDPEGHPDNAWKVVAQIELPGDGGGNLFVKSHPKSDHIWADRPLHSVEKLQRSVYVADKTTFKVIKRIEIPAKYPKARAVHVEYDKSGTEVWVSVWGNKETPTAILVYDDRTLELKNEITGDWVLTPTGHFNVYNTMKDVY